MKQDYLKLKEEMAVKENEVFKDFTLQFIDEATTGTTSIITCIGIISAE